MVAAYLGIRKSKPGELQERDPQTGATLFDLGPKAAVPFNPLGAQKRG